MAKEVILHKIFDWTKIDEKDSFWGKIELLKTEDNFGIHRYNNDLWTSGQVGVGRVFDKNNMPIQDSGKEHILIISSSYGLDPWKMLETVMLDDEYDLYTEELARDKKSLYHIFYNQPVIKIPQGIGDGALLLFALSYVHACYFLCKKGIKKSMIYHEENLTAKLRGKIDVDKNIKHNTAKGRCDKFYCKYIDFTEDTIENRIVKAALLRCQKILKEKFCKKYHSEHSIKSRISYCLNILRHVKMSTINSREFHAVTVSGLYSYYKPIIQQARAILSLDIQAYSDQVSGLDKKSIYIIPYTVNMETLFEYYARTELKKALKTSRYRVEKYTKKYYLQKDVYRLEDAEKGIHLMPFCIPDIVICDDGIPIAVIDAKYKLSGRTDRFDSHQLLAYVLLTGANRCGFIFPGNKTEVREMSTSGNDYLPLVPDHLRYYELFLGNNGDSSELKKILF